MTAAGYPGNPEKFEQRIFGLLDRFREQRLPKHVTDRYVFLSIGLKNVL